MMPNILIREDDEISYALRKSIELEGVDVHIKTVCKEIVIKNGKHFILCEKNGQKQAIEFDKILIAVGRTANTKGFGLKNIGTKLDLHGKIVVDNYLRSVTHKNIYACGDIVGPY